MSRVTTYSFCDSFIDRFTADLERDYIKTGRDLSRQIVVFGGRRPALFVKKLLSRKMGKAFYPPVFFSMDDFMARIVRKHEAFESARDLNQCYLMYSLARKHCPRLLVRRESFAQFLPWAREILSFIEQLDLECVDNKRLRAVEQNARIGYDVPRDINQMLEEITVLRDAYHQELRVSKTYPRGFQYLRAAELAGETSWEECDDILFANFFYLSRSEEAVIRSLYEAGRARLFFQGDQRRWPALGRLARAFRTEITEGPSVDTPAFDLKLYRGFDAHSQVCQLREILKTIDDAGRTVIVLPDSGNIIPLLSEIGPLVREFNISMGYPLKRSSLVSLIEQIAAAQNSRDGRGYYTRDYLNVLKHPLVKNLMLYSSRNPGGSSLEWGGHPAAEDSDASRITRVLIHKVEEVLTGMAEGPLTGCLFLSLEDLEASGDIVELAAATLRSMGTDIPPADLRDILGKIHHLCFSGWEAPGSFSVFARTLQEFLDQLVEKSVLKQYPLNIRIAARLYDLADELADAPFAREPFPEDEIFRVFLSALESEIVSFKGSPLKGLQILGLFETRSLNFRHVIIMDANEGVLPRLNIHESLIPRDVMIALDLDRLEQEEEIQRYGFMRLISSAETVHVLYQESRDRERSRFVEELVWQKEKAQGLPGVVPAVRCGFRVSASVKREEVRKTPQMIEFLKNYRYSVSSVQTYLRNPMEFYYQYVLGLREREDVLDEPQNRQVGIFLHELLREIFEEFIGKAPVVDQRFMAYARAVFQRRFQESFGKSRRPDAFFLRHVMESRLDQFLHREAERCGDIERIECLERPFSLRIPLEFGEIDFKCVVDRIDRMRDGTLLILDYKTGVIDHAFPKGLAEVEAVTLEREAVLEAVRSFQLPLYCYAIRRAYPGGAVDAGLYNLRTQEIKTFFGKKTGDDAGRVERAFLRALGGVVAELLDPDIPFIEADQSGRDPG